MHPILARASIAAAVRASTGDISSLNIESKSKHNLSNVLVPSASSQTALIMPSRGRRSVFLPLNNRDAKRSILFSLLRWTITTEDPEIRCDELGESESSLQPQNTSDLTGWVPLRASIGMATIDGKRWRQMTDSGQISSCIVHMAREAMQADPIIATSRNILTRSVNVLRYQAITPQIAITARSRYHAGGRATHRRTGTHSQDAPPKWHIDRDWTIVREQRPCKESRLTTFPCDGIKASP